MKISYNPIGAAAVTATAAATVKNDILFDLEAKKIWAKGLRMGADWEDISSKPSSLKNPTALTTFGVVYDGSITKTVTPSNFISQLQEDTSAVTDGTMFITSVATNNGFSDTNYVNIPYKRKASCLWDYIKTKTDALYSVIEHNHDNRYLKLTGGILTGNLTGTSAMFSGRFYGNGDDEGIIIKPADNGYAGLILGTHNGERSGFYFTKGNPFWRYNDGSVNSEIQHPKKSGIIALTSDIPNKNSWNYDDRYLKLTGGTMASDALITFSDSGTEGARGGFHWAGQSDWVKLYASETAENNLDLVIQFGDDNSNGLSIRNKSNLQTSYISSNGVITTGTFVGNLDWTYITNKPSSYTPSAHTHAWDSLTHTSNIENQAILTNGKTNGWKLQTLNIVNWDNAAINSHTHTNKSVLDGITSTLVSSWNTAYNFVSTITGTDTDKVINKWDEIVNFLADITITEDNTLNTLLNSKLSVYELSDGTNIGTIKNNGIYYSTTDISSNTLINSPFDNGFALINMTSYDGGDDLVRSRLAFNAYGEIKVSNDRNEVNTSETWYNVLTSKNSGINGSTITLNGTSITVCDNDTADSKYVKKIGDIMSGSLTIGTGNFGALVIRRNNSAGGAVIQFSGDSDAGVYGYIGLDYQNKDKQLLRWKSDALTSYTILDTSSTYTSDGKGIINGIMITKVENATNATHAASADSATRVKIYQNTDMNAIFPLIWSDSATTNNGSEGRLCKSWEDLYYNPKRKMLTVAGSVNTAFITATNTITSAGFVHSEVNENPEQYVLTADGGCTLFDQTSIEPVHEFSKNITVTSEWMDIDGFYGGNNNFLTQSGTYIVQVYVNGTDDDIWENYFSGIMSWYTGQTNSNNSDEIILHRVGHDYSNTIYLRTKESPTPGYAKLQISANTNLLHEHIYTFKFKRIC